MAGFQSEVDVAVIGAGAAGIGAARRLFESSSVSVLVLEARNRVGGRVHTVEPAGFPLDRGAEWLHSADRNPLSPIARNLGFRIHCRPPEWINRLRRSGETIEAEVDWIATREAQRRARRKNAAELAHVSVKDYVRYEDSGVNWRLREGYGRLFERLAEGLPVALEAAVSRIDHAGRTIRLET